MNRTIDGRKGRSDYAKQEKKIKVRRKSYQKMKDGKEKIKMELINGKGENWEKITKKYRRVKGEKKRMQGHRKAMSYKK